MGTGQGGRMVLCPAVAAVAVVFCFCVAENAAGQDVSERFDMLYEYYATEGNAFHYNEDDLETIQIDWPYFHDIFPEGMSIHFNSGLANTINEDFEPFPGEVTPPYIRKRLIQTRLAPHDTTQYTVDFDAGFSVDPGFVISRATLGKTTYRQMAGGTECMIPGDGYIYIHGHVNSMYDVRRRYRYDIETDTLIEDRQQVYYVGIKTETLQDITLTGIPESSGTTLRIAKGEPVTVLAADGDRYLVLTETGLTGWISIPSGYESPIKHLFYRGD